MLCATFSVLLKYFSRSQNTYINTCIIKCNPVHYASLCNWRMLGITNKYITCVIKMWPSLFSLCVSVCLSVCLSDCLSEEHWVSQINTWHLHNTYVTQFSLSPPLSVHICSLTSYHHENWGLKTKEQIFIYIPNIIISTAECTHHLSCSLMRVSGDSYQGDSYVQCYVHHTFFFLS